jgi:Uma2 family endonuclease
MAIATTQINSENIFELSSKITVEQYYRMAVAGYFSPEQRLELIKGEIINMSPIGRKHGSCVARLQRLFDRIFERILNAEGIDRGIVWTQNSIALDRNSEPQPDIAVLKFREDFYEERLPIPDDILLIIEVADSTIGFDRDVKIPLYAKFGIIEAWIVDLNKMILTKYTQPSSAGYLSSQVFNRSDVIIWNEQKIELKDILRDILLT